MEALIIVLGYLVVIAAILLPLAIIADYIERKLP